MYTVYISVAEIFARFYQMNKFCVTCLAKNICEDVKMYSVNKSRFQGILRPSVEVGDNDDDIGGWSGKRCI